jgi:hypothetical protein
MITKKFNFAVLAIAITVSLFLLNNESKALLVGETKGKKAIQCGQWDSGGNQTQAGNTCGSGGQGCAANPCGQ